MPPRPRRRSKDQDVELVTREPEEIEEDEEEEDDDEDLKLDGILARLTGGRITATVWKTPLDEFGQAAGEEHFSGKLNMPPDADSEWILEQLQRQYGGGAYRLQFRKVGEHGTAGNVAGLRVGAPVRSDQGVSAPAATERDPMRDLLLAQNREMMAMVKEQLGRNAAAAAAPPVQPALDQLATMLKFAKAIARDQATPDRPAWLQELLSVAGAAGVSVVLPLLKKLSSKMEAMDQKALPEGGARSASPARSAPDSPATIDAPGAAEIDAAADGGASQPGAPASDDVTMDQNAIVVRALRAVLKQEKPDPKAGAALAMEFGAAEIRALVETYQPGKLAAQMELAVPELATRHPGYAAALETELRALATTPK